MCFDVSALVQWYAYLHHPSGIQRVMESILGCPELVLNPDVDFIARPAGAKHFYRVDKSYVRDLTNPALRRQAIASLRALFADSLRKSSPRRLWNEMIHDHTRYFAIGWSGASRYWAAHDCGAWPPKARFPDAFEAPLGSDTIVILGDFWCQKRHVESLVSLKSRHGARLIALIHDLFPMHRPDWTHPKYGQEFVSQFLTLANHVDQWLTTSNFVREQLARTLTERELPVCPIEIMPMGWPDNEKYLVNGADDAAVLQRYELRQSGYFLCVGTIEPRKNIERVIEASLALGAGGAPNRPVCVIVGKGGWKCEALLERLRTLNGTCKSLRWISDVDDEVLKALYRNARFTVVPSHNEGWGLVVQESLAHGVPCIAPAIGGVLESGRGLATFVSPDDPSAFLEMIRDYAGGGENLSIARQRIEQRLKAGPLLPRWSHSVECLARLTGLHLQTTANNTQNASV